MNLSQFRNTFPGEIIDWKAPAASPDALDALFSSIDRGAPAADGGAGGAGGDGAEAVDGVMDIHDWHATILHVMGLDHEALTYPYAGRNFRLTDVHGEVARDILA